jgi:hypothetical protein
MKKETDQTPFEKKHRSGEAQQGAALLFLIVAMTIFAALGTAMLSLFGTAQMSQFQPNQVRRANYMAESGARYALSEVRRLAPPQNVSPVTLANWWTARFNELCNGGNVAGKTFTISSGVNSFNLKINPYWFKVTTAGTNLTTVNADVPAQGLPPALPGEPGIATGSNSFPVGTRIQIGANSPVEINVANTTVSANRKSVTFVLLSPVNIDTAPADGYLVFSPTVTQTINMGDNLTLALNTLNPIPRANGTIIINGKVYTYESTAAGSTVLKNVRWKGSTPTVVVNASDDIVFGQNARIVSTGIYNFGGSIVQRQTNNYTGFASASISSYRPPTNNVTLTTSFNDLSSLDLGRSGDRVIVQGYIATGGVHMYWAAFTKLGLGGYRFHDPADNCWVGYHVAPLSLALRNSLRDSFTIHQTLSYDIQIKMGWDLHVDYAATGLSFRWHVPDAYDQTSGPRQGYGVSIMRYQAAWCPGNHKGDYIPNGMKPDYANPGLNLEGKLIAVLWRQNATGPNDTDFTVEALAYAVLGDPTWPCDPTTGCLGRWPWPDQDQKITGNQGWPDGRVNDDATIIVRVEDKFLANFQRINEIKLFWADSSPKFDPRVGDSAATNTDRKRYCAQWVNDGTCNGNTLFPTWPRNLFVKDGSGYIANWYNNDTTRDYFTLASNHPTAPHNAVVWRKLASAPGDIILSSDATTIRTTTYVLDSFSATREEVGLHAMGDLDNSNNTVAFDDLSIQILGENE